jgi:hypothetical protein
MSPGLSVEANWVSTQASKMRRFIGQSITHSAVRPSWRSAAMKVWVPQWPKGAFIRSRSARRARPRNWVILVVVPVSSTNTRRCGRRPIHGCDARATFAAPGQCQRDRFRWPAEFFP